MTKSFIKKNVLLSILACLSACILACQSSKSILEQTIEEKSVSKRKLKLIDVKEYFSDKDYTEYFYDENGLGTSYKSSSGLISWNEYNEAGLLIYRKNKKTKEL